MAQFILWIKNTVSSSWLSWPKQKKLLLLCLVRMSQIHVPTLLKYYLPFFRMTHCQHYHGEQQGRAQKRTLWTNSVFVVLLNRFRLYHQQSWTIGRGICVCPDFCFFSTFPFVSLTTTASHLYFSLGQIFVSLVDLGPI